MENNQTYLNNQVSVFPNCKTTIPPEAFTIGVLLELIREGYFSKEVKEYQDLLKDDPEKARHFKSSAMLAITCEGIFKKRNKDGLITPSGIIVLDVDDVPEEIFTELKTSLSKDKYTLAAMDSPGGHGLKVFVLMHFGHGEETYKYRYNEVMNYYASTYSIPVCEKRSKNSSSWGLDRACSDISRLCILGPSIIINGNPEVFEVFQTFSPTEMKVRKLVEKICEQQVDITSSYDDWLRIGFGFKYEFGEDGRPYFHQVSQFYPKYSEKESDQKFSSITGAPDKPVTIATFFDSCKTYGVFASMRLPQGVDIVEPHEILMDEEIVSKKFPIKVFAGQLSNFIEEASRSINCPMDYLGVSVLSVIGITMGRKFCIAPKTRHREFGTLYLAMVGDPGSKKSPSLREAADPVYIKQKELKKEYDREKMEYQLLLEAYNADKNLDKPEKPVLRRVVGSDATMESMATMLEQNPIGMGFIFDELLAWINSCNQYKQKGTDHQKYLSLWSGTDIHIDRKHEETKMIFNPFITLIGGIQPEVLKDLSKGRNDGFLDRILFCFPERMVSRYSKDRITDVTLEEYHKKILQLFDRATEDFNSNGCESFRLEMTDDQFDKWRTWVNTHHEEVEAIRFPYYLKGPWAKMEAHSLRLILLLAYSRTQIDEKVEIQKRDIEGGIELAEYFKSHIRKAYHEIYSSEDDKKILLIVEYIKGKGGTVSARDVYRNRIGGCKSRKDTEELFNEMESRELGKIHIAATTLGGKKSMFFVLDQRLM